MASITSNGKPPPGDYEYDTEVLYEPISKVNLPYEAKAYSSPNDSKPTLEELVPSTRPYTQAYEHESVPRIFYEKAVSTPRTYGPPQVPPPRFSETDSSNPPSRGWTRECKLEICSKCSFHWLIIIIIIAALTVYYLVRAGQGKIPWHQVAEDEGKVITNVV